MLMVIIKKELKRVFTDRRLIVSTFILPAVAIYIMYSLMGNMAGSMMDDINEHYSTVYVSGSPESFTLFYEAVQDQYNMNVTFGNYQKSDFEEEILSGEVDLLVVFEEDFDNKILNYKDTDTLPEIKTYYNPTEEYSSSARSKFVYDLLEAYKSGVLHERYGNLNYIQAFSVDATNQESEIMDEKKAGSMVLSMMMPMLIAILLFAGAMGIGLDTIAGEKERGTMATLLLTPVKRETIALGKVIGLAIISIIGAFTSFVAIIASLPNMMNSFSGGTDSLDVGIKFSAFEFIALFVIMISLVGIFVSLVCAISVRARTMKEASAYVSPVYMIIMGVSITTMFNTSSDVALYKFAIPVYGGILLIQRLFDFSLTIPQLAVSTGVSLAATALIIWFITKTFNDEKVMFNA